MARHILVAVAWPYANGLQHLGHIGGAYLPADIFARYHRIAGNAVLMVSGSDAHGTPITVEADKQGVSPREIVDRYHPTFLEQWDRLGIDFDLFTTTMTENHHEVTRDVFSRLRDRGYIDKRTTEQLYDPEAERFLPDRYVEGTCPHCGYERARGDQCENCGRTLDPPDLIDPRSKITGAHPETRSTEHYFILLPELQDQLLAWLDGKEGWRPHVINWALGFIRENGLIERAITRDLTWGVELPADAAAELDNAEDKRIYVWFDAVIGYLSAAKEWAQLRGEPEAWRAWWEDDAAESYYFVGKDNIDFHAIFWPAMLIGYGGLNLATNVPANQYITFGGEKASKSRNVGEPVLEVLDKVQPDAVRYAVASVLPESNDVDLTDDEMERRINDELVATWGNLVNRVLAMTAKNFDSVVPEASGATDRDRQLLADVDAAIAETGHLIERVELRAGLRRMMEAAQAANVYLSELEPWKTAKSDLERTGVTLATALAAIAGIAVGLAPYLPFSSLAVLEALGLDGGPQAAGWHRPELAAGTALSGLEPLFAKVELTDDD